MNGKGGRATATKERVTIYRIAREAGVSVASVSRVLTGNARVAEEKRRRIEEAISKHSFRPSAIARSLKRQKSRVIGVILPDVSHPFWGSAFLGAESQAVERGYSLLLGNTLNDRAGHVTHVESRLLEVMLDKRVDGIILMGGRVNEARPIPEHRDEVRRVMSQVPVVTCGRMKGLGCWTVEIDEPRTVALAVDHLVALGHRRLGFLGGMRGIEPTDARIAAFGALLQGHGLPFEPAWCVEGGFGIEDGKATTESFLAMRDRPTALVCFNDMTAIGVLSAARQCGLRVPEELSVVGIDNIALTEFVHPRLTSVDLDARRYGSSAVALMVDVLEARRPRRHVVLEPSLIVRDSCTRPAGQAPPVP